VTLGEDARSFNKLSSTFFSCFSDAVIRVYDEAGNVIETHQHKGDFKEW
jgi:hypothetical protein